MAVLTREDILSVHSRNVVINSGSVKIGVQTNVEGPLSEYDRDSVKVSIGSISGVRTIHATNTQADHLMLTIDSRLESGNAAIVIVVDGEFYCEVSANAQEMINIPKAAGKLVEVRLAGKSEKSK